MRNRQRNELSKQDSARARAKPKQLTDKEREPFSKTEAPTATTQYGSTYESFRWLPVFRPETPS